MTWVTLLSFRQKRGIGRGSCSVVSDSLQPHGLQYIRPLCLPPTPRVYSNSCPLSQWCHPTILSSVISFSSCLQSLPAPGSLITSQIFTSGGQALELQDQSFQSIFRTDFLQDGLVGSPCSPRDSQESSPIPQFKSINLWCSAFFMAQITHSYMATGKNHSFD